MLTEIENKEDEKYIFHGKTLPTCMAPEHLNSKICLKFVDFSKIKSFEVWVHHKEDCLGVDIETESRTITYYLSQKGLKKKANESVSFEKLVHEILDAKLHSDDFTYHLLLEISRVVKYYEKEIRIIFSKTLAKDEVSRNFSYEDE